LSWLWFLTPSGGSWRRYFFLIIISALRVLLWMFYTNSKWHWRSIIPVPVPVQPVIASVSLGHLLRCFRYQLLEMYGFAQLALLKQPRSPAYAMPQTTNTHRWTLWCFVVMTYRGWRSNRRDWCHRKGLLPMFGDGLVVWSRLMRISTLKKFRTISQFHGSAQNSLL